MDFNSELRRFNRLAHRGAADGKFRVDVHCQKCGRRWLRLKGDPGAGLARRGVTFIWPDLSGGIPRLGEGWRYFDPWTGKTTKRKPGVTVTEAREPVGKKERGPRRYRVECHSDCGRVETLTYQRLAEEFSAAVTETRHTTRL